MESKLNCLDRLVAAREAMHLLSVGSTTLYKFVKLGKLTPVKFGSRCTRFRLSEIVALICANAVPGGAA